jgi:hypothetical protein
MRAVTTLEPWVAKRVIAAHYGRTTRWVEYQMKQGMPHRKDHPTAWPMFRLSEVDAWLTSRRRGTSA